MNKLYHYTMCGLDNVWLSNGYTEHKTAYGKGVAIHDAEGLHRLIAKNLLNKTGRLTGKEFKFLRTLLVMSQSGLGTLLGVTEQAVSLWERTGKVPKGPDNLLRIICMGHLNQSAPVMKAVERINSVESLVHQRIVASTKGNAWSSKVEEEKHEVV